MLSSFLALLGFAATAFGITVTTSTASYTIDSGDTDGFVVAVSRSTGDITSILYRGTQYQYQSTYSHIASGLGSATVSYTTVGKLTSLYFELLSLSSIFSSLHIARRRADDFYSCIGTRVVVKCVADNADFDLTHYYIFEDGTSLIYMGTYTVSEPSIGELRYIYRLTGLTAAYKEGDVSNTNGGTAIEASDVYTVSGQTRSKVSFLHLLLGQK